MQSLHNLHFVQGNRHACTEMKKGKDLEDPVARERGGEGERERKESIPEGKRGKGGTGKN